MNRLEDTPIREQRTRSWEENNSFDVLRLVLALLVVYTHAHAVGGFGLEGFTGLVNGQTLAGNLAVLGFFGISGFLVARSFSLRAEWRPFLASRLLRIMPGFYFALFMTACVFAPAICYFNGASGGWSLNGALGYMAHNAALQIHRWSVGNSLAGLPFPEAINGALWSLFPEFCCYVMLLVLGLLGALGERRVNLVIVAVIMFVIHAVIILLPEHADLVPAVFAAKGGLSPFFVAFLVGTCLYAFRGELGLGGKLAVFWWLLAFLLLRTSGWNLFGPIVFPLAIIHTAYSFQRKLPVDLSYGMYVLHFPVMHLLSAAGLNKNGYWLYLLASLAITAVFAAFSWYCIEKQALKLKKRKRAPRPQVLAAAGDAPEAG